MRRTNRLVLLTLVVGLVLTVTGCGFIFVNGPPAEHQQMDYFTCTESNVGPILDAVWGGLNAAGALTAAADPDAYQNSSTVITSGLIWTGVSGAASIVGFNKTSECRAAKRAHAQRQSSAEEPDSIDLR